MRLFIYPLSVGPACHRRTFFSPPSSNIQTFAERQWMRFTAPQLFNLVNDVPSYKYFLPYCTGSHLIEGRTPNLDSTTPTQRRVWTYRAELEVGVGPLVQEKYSSHVTASTHPLRVEARADPSSTTLFHHLQTEWTFEPAVRGQGCWVGVSVRVGWRQGWQQGLLGWGLSDVGRTMVQAFEKRAEELYRKRH